MEVNAGAVDLATRLVHDEGLADRISVTLADVTKLSPRPEWEDVDVLFCFFLGHDFWPRARCLETLRTLRTVFPRAGRFLLCDTYRSDLPPSQDLPTFTLGFEFTHAVMGQYIPSVAEWMDLFVEAGWTCVDRCDVDIPFSSIFDLRWEG